MATISPGDLVAEHLSGRAARPVADARRALVARGMRFATVGPDPASVTPVCTVSARDLPVVEVLAALAAQDPTGVLVIETSDDAFAFEVDRGRLTGARGRGPLDRLEPFVAEVHRRHPERFGHDDVIGRDHPAWMRVARAFVEERVLDQLALGRQPGTRMTLVRGDVEWIGTRLPPSVGPTLGHVLLEQARRFDELPKIEVALGDLERIAVPLAEPGARPEGVDRSGSGNDWDFFSDPDPAALAEWDDAVEVFKLCDGESSLAEIVENAMLGQFRGMLALRTLVATRCIVLIEPVRRSVDVAARVEQVRPLRAAVATDPDLPEPDEIPGISATSYSIVSRPTPPPGPRRATPPKSAPPKSASPKTAPPKAVAVSRTRPTPVGSDRTPLPVRRTPVPFAPEPSVDIPTTVPAGAAIAETGAPSAVIEPEPSDELTPRAARSLVAARALDQALPSANAVMVVLGATGLVALAAAVVALV